DPGVATPHSCTELFDVHVPLVAVYDAHGQITRFNKGQMVLTTYFVPTLVDRAGDKMQLNCLPSAPAANCTQSLSSIDMRKANDSCWNTAPPDNYPQCAVPTSNVASCDDYFPGCKVQDAWPGTPPGCAPG